MADQNFSMHSGDSKAIAFTIYTTDGTTAVDISTATAITWSMATAPNVTAAVTKTLAAGTIAVSGDSNNIATVTLAATDTASLKGLYYHELQVTDSASLVYTAASGWVVIEEDLIT